MTVPRFDEVQIRRFLPHVMVDGYCLELRAFHAQLRNGNVVDSQGFNSTIGGYFDDLESLIAVATHFDGISPYITPNPVKHDLIARIANKVRRLARGDGTKDEDIAFIRWIPLDLDPVRPDGISSTDEELQTAVSLRDRILTENPEIQSSSIWGKSGNGCWIWVRVPDLPNTPETLERVKRFIGWFAARYGDKGQANGREVIIDRKTCNASRVMAFPGVLKCKGENDRKRPWRLATIDSPAREDGSEVQPIDLDRWEQGKEFGPAPIVSSHAGQHSTSAGSTDGPIRLTPDHSVFDRSDRIYRATCYLAKKPPAISGQGGHDQTYYAAVDLVHGFGLTISEARPILEAWNQLCQPPWESFELERKLSEAENTPHQKPHGHLYYAGQGKRAIGAGGAKGYQNGEGINLIRSLYPTARAEAPEVSSESLAGQLQADPTQVATTRIEETSFGSNEAIDDPHRIARLFLWQTYTHVDRLTLRFHDDQFWGWNDSRYFPVPLKEINARINGVAKQWFDEKNLEEVRAWAARGKKDPDGKPCLAPVAKKVGTRLVGDTHSAVMANIILKASTPVPSWIGGNHTFNPAEILPCKNVLVHLPSYVDGKDNYAVKATPDYFGTYALDYEFNENAPFPSAWHNFLDGILGHDLEAINTLQEWFGYCLIADTTQQKILTLIGPRRAGKDTIARVLRAMLGPANVAGPTLASLSTNFGLSPLIGKPAAIVSDARLSSRTDQAIIVERLLTISGEGTITIDRKHLNAWTGKLPTRLIIISNEVPRLYDTSGALSGRLILLRLTKTFFGKEDTKLFDKLLPELPGILLWAIEGWRRLQDQGHFIQPESGKELIEEMEETESPTKAFVNEWCDVGKDHKIERKSLYQAWRAWCVQNGRKEPGDPANFGRHLRAAVQGLTTSQPRDDRDKDKKVRVYSGINLKPGFLHWGGTDPSWNGKAS